MHFSLSSALIVPSFLFIVGSSPVPVVYPRQFSSTANDLVDGKCAPVTLIFARGTTEPGNIGIIVGPPLESALQSTLGADNVIFQGVDYPADVQGFLVGGDPDGAETMAGLAQQAVNQCAGTQVVMSGYR